MTSCPSGTQPASSQQNKLLTELINKEHNMPSSKNYKRDYEQEAKTAKARGENEDDAARHRLRREAVKKGIVDKNDGKDLDHKQALSKGGSNSLSNARATSPGENRSFARNSDGSMKSQTSKRERK